MRSSDQLNYSYLNEDPALERAVLRTVRGTRALCVAGSGMRAVALLTDRPLDLTILDKNPVQLAFARLHLRSLIELDYKAYHRFWGTPGFAALSVTERDSLFPEAKTFKPPSKLDPLYWGRHEQGLRKRARWIRLLLKSNSQLESIKISWPRWRALTLVAAPILTLMELGQFIPKAEGESHVAHYTHWLHRIATDQDPKSNWLLQQFFWGQLLKAQAHVLHDEQFFARTQRNAKDSKIEFCLADLQADAGTLGSFDFISLSNLISYYGAKQANDLLSHLARITASRGKLALRFFFNHPVLQLGADWQDLTPSFATDAASEKTAIYDFQILERRSH